MTKIKLLIVDDEPLAHKVLEGYCDKIDHVEVIGNCFDGLSTLNFLNKEKVDAVLLDIQMPDITGLELLDTLKNNAPKIIFTTAYSEYALQGFDYDQVVDYLHKPIRLTRFIKALERLKKVLMLESKITENPLPVSTEDTTLTSNDFISIKDNKVIYRISHSEINYIQSWGNYLKFHLKDQSIKIARKTIKVAESELPPNNFLRIHKSYIVNIDQIKAIEGSQVRIGDQHLPIGKSYLVSVKKIVSG